MPVTRRRGFTLIELLIVVVVIGILAAIAVPKFQVTKGRANAAALRSDLRNLASVQESYFYSHTTYSADSAALQLTTSNGVVLTLVEATGSGWSAIATHPQSYPLTCALYMGFAAPVAPATSEGVVACQ